MKKLTLIVLFFTSLINAQVASLPSSTAMSSTRYEGASVNESSGRLIQSIPLLNYSVGKLNIPIAMNYVGNGVKVSQISSWVGTNWDLSAGGVITRTVNSYPDELASERIFFEQLEVQGDTLPGYQYQPQENDTRDFRVDLFSFSFPGYSGSFYLDQNMIPRLLDNNTELKIEFIGLVPPISNYTIVITTPTGEKYYFGGSQACESSSSLIKTPIKSHPLTTQEAQAVNQTVSPLAITAFYLYKVENYYGDQILIDYYDNGTKNFVLFERQELPLIRGINNVEASCWDIEDFNGLRKQVFHGTISNSKKIKRIYSNSSNLRIDFVSSDLLLSSDGIIDTPQYSDKKLDSIYVYNTDLNENIKKISLDYLLPNGQNSSRFFLSKISFNNNPVFSGDTCESFNFQYNQPEDLPSRFSWDIDLLGYYNGETNTTLIGQNEDLEFDNAFQNLAVRESNFEFASKGALTRIINPMGGVTEFEYENPEVSVIKQVGKQLFLYRNKSELIPSSELVNSFNIGGEMTLEGDPVLYNPKNQVLKVQVNVNASSTGSHHGHKVYVDVKDLTTNVTQTQYIQLVHQVTLYNKHFDFNLIKDHAYNVKLRMDPSTTDPQYSSLDVYGSFEYDFYEGFPAMGLRLKSIKTFSDSTSSTTLSHNRYYYKSAKNVFTANDDSAVVMFEPELNTKVDNYCCSLNNVDYHFQTVSLIADPFAYYFSGSDNQTQYKCVTISYGGDFFEKGGVEKHFKVEKKSDVIQHLYGDFIVTNESLDFGSVNTDNTDIFNGTLIKEKIIERVPDIYPIQLNFKSETEFIYNQSIDYQINNVVIVKNPEGCITSEVLFPGDPAIGHYSNYSFKNNLVSTIHHEFITPFSVNSELTYDKISTVTNYEYGSLRGIPSKISKTDSKEDTVISEFKYVTPSDLLSISSGLSGADLSAYNALYAQNNIASPIQTTVKKQKGSNPAKTLSTTRSLYFLGSNNQVLPKKVMASKANFPLKGNVEFTTYDTKNNLVEVTQENQIKKSIIYGYDDQMIIAELINVEYDDIVNNGSLLNDLKTLSNSITDETSELALYNALNQLRTVFPNAQISTNVYNKYLQLKSSTDSRSYSVYYEYDDCKRLRLTKDKDGKIIEEYKYNLKNN